MVIEEFPNGEAFEGRLGLRELFFLFLGCRK